jgi:hypothetical protein
MKALRKYLHETIRALSFGTPTTDALQPIHSSILSIDCSLPVSFLNCTIQ